MKNRHFRTCELLQVLNKSTIIQMCEKGLVTLLQTENKKEPLVQQVYISFCFLGDFRSYQPKPVELKVFYLGGK